MLAGLDNPGRRMNVGKTLFAQVMEFVPWKTFGRIVERHKGDAGVRTLGCAELFRVMVLAIAVGMPVTRHPPHRSVRAQLRHTAPTSGI